MNDDTSNHVVIPLSKTGKHAGKYTTIVSIEDADLADLNWTVRISSSKMLYAKRGTWIHGRSGMIHLHRLILERKLDRPLESHEIVDHINHDGLDNRRENLRLATHSQNKANTKKNAVNKSGHKGVYWRSDRNKWVARIMVNHITQQLGHYDTIDEAIEAYKKAAIEYYGEFAYYD